MGRLLGALAAVLASCSAPPPTTDPNALALKTGSDLLAVCSHQGERGEEAVGMEMVCLGYIASAVDSYSVAFCEPPETSTTGQARDPVVQYLRDHPEAGKGLAIGEAWQALSQAWPCSTPRGRKR
jgi:hypothetical protein